MLTQVAVIVVLEATAPTREARPIDIDLSPEGVVTRRLARAGINAIGAIASARLEHILVLADQEVAIAGAQRLLAVIVARDVDIAAIELLTEGA
ncbi:hypothetical protein D3C87_1121920 [compost metagenome]